MLLVIDVSNMFITKQELNNINKIVLNYGLDIIEEENIDSKLEELINKNISVNEHTSSILIMTGFLSKMFLIFATVSHIFSSKMR